MRNSLADAASLEAMITTRKTASYRLPQSIRRPGGRTDPLEGSGPWIVFAIGVLLMLAAALVRGEEPAVAHRTEKFSASLPARATLRVRNVSGDIVATSGREFLAVCQTTVTASTKARAEELLGRTRTEQTRNGDDFSLESRWPEMSDDSRHGGHQTSWSSRSGDSHAYRCRDCRITMRYELIIPPGVVAILHTVNGDVKVQDVDGDLDVQSVNGNLIVTGSRRGVAAQTVNGKVQVAAAAVVPESAIELKTVSGSVLLTLPKDAKFDLAANTMNGSIASTFPLPAGVSREEGPGSDDVRRPRHAEPPKPPKARTPRSVVIERDGEETIVDVPELEREIQESMKEVDAQMRESLRDSEREFSRMKVVMPGGEYRGSIGQGGARVRLSTLNGRILLLAAGTSDADAKPLVARRSFVVTIPRVDVQVPEVRVRIPEVRVHVPRVDVRVPNVRVSLPGDESVVRGDVSGDFLATAGGGTYRIGRVSGRVNILTHSGEIHIASVGGAADVKTYGGDIQIGPVVGDLKAKTLAGDIRAETVGGSASVETSGGDIRIVRVAGSADARTGGGDIVLPAVAGGVHAETGGGEVRIGVVSREAKGGVQIRNAGGDVTLTLPANFRGEVEITASDADLDETAIRSDFPEITVTRRSGSQQGAGTLNGGGSRVTIRTSSGSIRIRKGPAA